MGLAHCLDLGRAQGKSPHQQDFVNEANCIQQASVAQVIGDWAAEGLKFGSMLIDELERRYGEDICFAGLELQHAAAVGAADRLCAEERHRVQCGKGQQLSTDPAGL